MSTLLLLSVNSLAQSITSDFEHSGLLESKPAEGNLGEWLVGGESFIATENTVFDTEKGPLEIGVCAEVDYFFSGSDKIAAGYSIDSQNF